MKQNILVVSYDYDLSKSVAKKLAEEFSMRVFDQIELFEFDHAPKTLSGVLMELGEEYVLKELRSIVKMELDFDNSVFVASLDIADHCFDLFYRIKLNNFTVLLFKNTEQELKEIKAKKYSTRQMKNFFDMDRESLERCKGLIENECADISVDVTGLDEDTIGKAIINKIKDYYSIQ